MQASSQVSVGFQFGQAPVYKEVGLSAVNDRHFPQPLAHRAVRFWGARSVTRRLEAKREAGPMVRHRPTLAYTPQLVRTIGMWQICLLPIDT